jgi:hypothetical protein
VDEPWRPRAARPKPKHAAPGAFKVPPELLTSPAQSELVVGIVQDGLNRWDTVGHGGTMAKGDIKAPFSQHPENVVIEYDRI